MRVLFIATAAAAVLSIAVRPAQSQAIPDLNVDPVCHGIAQQAADQVREGRAGSCFLEMRSKRTGHAPKTRQRMVDVFADR